jgi:hypothetical protein
LLVKVKDNPVIPARGPQQRPSAPVRRSDRVTLVIPIEAFVTDLSGRLFSAPGRTLIVSRFGATIVLSHTLATDQELTIRCLTNRKKAAVRVLGPMGGRGHEFVYGIALLDGAVNPWGIEFPPLTGAKDMLARTVFQCGTCLGLEVVYLNEIEFQVFEANQSIPRFCGECSATTSWKQAEFPDAQSVSNEGHQQPGSSGAEAQEVKKKRKYARVQTKVSACIRQLSFPDEIVQCENYSRGGFCFASSTHYREGSRIEVALPYSTTGNGNIFVHSRIAHVQKVGNKFRIGSAYVRAYDEKR